ncbi:hypothetical protein IV417_07575 [Alphaproteobacteria bacterium KMM 3653]|uniref:Uncharacterized protein n=1 Tax=Harenicola maris TaxID=2841044 RepID=A0AAP2G889_9RHOB|nr:hypothetical protein [Harenicola maris]
MAKRLGFCEFYAPAPTTQPGTQAAWSQSPEQAELLSVLPDFPEPPSPRIVCDQGVERPGAPVTEPIAQAAPSQTAAEIRRNAGRGLPQFSPSWLTRSELAEHWAAHVAGSTNAGLRARPEDWRVARTVLICEDPARAEAAIKSGSSPCRAYYKRILGAGADDAAIDRLIDASAIYGTLPRVLEALKNLASTSAPFGTLTVLDHNWADAALGRNSLMSLANAAYPLFRRGSIAS